MTNINEGLQRKLYSKSWVGLYRVYISLESAKGSFQDDLLFFLFNKIYSLEIILRRLGG